MPTVTVTGFAAHAVALTANTETIVELGVDCSSVEVLSLVSTQPVYFTVDGSAATVGGTRTFVVPAGVASAAVPVPAEVGLTKVRLISTANATVSVTRA